LKGRFTRDALNIGVAVAVFVIAFGFYNLTGPSDVSWMEGAEFQRRVAQTEFGQGPWDRPLFVFLSQPFLFLPWGELARRANWASATFAAGACLFVYLLLKILLQMTPQFIARRVGILAAVSLAVSHTFWMRAVTPGPEPLDALLLAAILYFLIRFANLGGALNLYLGMGILGLALANNLLVVFLIPIIFIFVRVVHPPLMRNAGSVRFRGLIVFVIGASLAVAVVAWGWTKTGFLIPAEQKTWLSFWDHMMLTWGQPLKQSLLRFGAMLLLNFPPWTAVIGLIGLYELYRRQKYVFFLVFPLFLVYAFLVITLNLERPVPAYLPAWVILSIAVGFGWWKLLSSGSWQGFAIAIVLSTSPLVIYRFAPMAVRQVRMERRAEALLNAPVELPLDPLAFQLNPDRRDLRGARDYATGALAQLPENAVVLSPTRTSELLVAPMRYVSEVESAGAIPFVSLGDDPQQRLRDLTAPSAPPVYAKGLRPANPAVTALLDTHLFLARGEWFQLVSKSSVTDRVLVDAPIPGVPDDALGDEQLVGRWYGYVKPSGYPLTLWIQGTPGNLTGTAVLNEEGARPETGRFNRLSSTVGAVLGSVEYGEPGTDQLHFHIDATQRGNRLEGTWSVFEIAGLAGEFVVWKQP
jgi:hypothetical protein